MDESLRLPPRLAAILEDPPVDRLALVPLPVKPRFDGWTSARQLAFSVRPALLFGVAAAAKAVVPGGGEPSFESNGLSPRSS
jgi:hypothetical protein